MENSKSEGKTMIICNFDDETTKVFVDVFKKYFDNWDKQEKKTSKDKKGSGKGLEKDKGKGKGKGKGDENSESINEESIIVKKKKRGSSSS
jgi:hypothetical protein